MVGRHECTNYPPALFDEQGNLRRGLKSTLIDLLLDDMHLIKRNNLPDHKSTSVVVDAMHMIRKWSFLPDETFHNVQK